MKNLSVPEKIKHAERLLRAWKRERKIGAPKPDLSFMQHDWLAKHVEQRVEAEREQ